MLRDLSALSIYTSDEPKAIETAAEIGRLLGMPVEVAPGVHEQERPRLPFYEVSEWHRIIDELFANPEAVVLGHESANQAKSRFASAIESLTMATQDDDLIVVTHGTVMSLYLSSLVAQDAFTIWTSLEMPDVRIVALNASA